MTHTTFKTSRRSDSDYFEWRKYRAFQAIKLLEKHRSLNRLKVLDIGCGVGALLAALSEKEAIPVGIETDKDSIALAKKFTKGKISIIEGQAEKLSFKNQTFDIIFLFDVIEHVKYPIAVIEESKRVLKPGGLL